MAIYLIAVVIPRRIAALLCPNPRPIMRIFPPAVDQRIPRPRPANDEVIFGPVEDFGESHPLPCLPPTPRKMSLRHLETAEAHPNNVEVIAKVHLNRPRFHLHPPKAPRPSLRRGSTIGPASGENENQ